MVKTGMSSGIACRPRGAARVSQCGQALIYGLSVLAFGMGILYFVYRVGELVDQKIRLVDTADTAAYSAAVMDSRLLNFIAYSNRAMLAESVTIAQLVSLSSWLAYTSNLSQARMDFLSSVNDASRYPSLQGSLSAADTVAAQAQATQSVLRDLRQQADADVHDVLMKAQGSALAAFAQQRRQVLDAVASAAGFAQGALQVELLPSPQRPELAEFVHLYSGSGRERFAKVVVAAVDSEAFNSARNWSLTSERSDCPGAASTGRLDTLLRRGGTNLLNLDEWRAVDTLSEHGWKPRADYGGCARQPEAPVAIGTYDVASQPAGVDLDPLHYGGSASVNPLATYRAQALDQPGASNERFRGIPAVYGLAPDELANQDPRLRLAVRVSLRPGSGNAPGSPTPCMFPPDQHGTVGSPLR